MMIGNEVSDSIATEKNPRDLVFTELESSPAVLESSLTELPLFPPISREPSGTKDKTHTEGIIGRKQRACHCKQSKCLKLYCDCFASGVFCTDCDCADCHNTSENCDVRQAALMNVLDRYPNDFRKPPSKQYEEAHVIKLALRSRGCKCKRTKCLKKYCECFQANVLCSDSCQCISCENVTEVIQHTVSAWGLNNRESYEKPENKYNALGISSPNGENIGLNSHNATGCMNKAAHNSPQVYQRRKYREQPELKSCPPPLRSIPENSTLNALASPMSSSPKLPYRKKRSRLGYTSTRLPDLGDLCSLLLDASKSATANAGITSSATSNAGNTPVLDLQSDLADPNGLCIKPGDKEDKSSASESRSVEEQIQSCGRLIELIDAQYNEEKDSQRAHETDTYIKQERAVLESFRDCLQKFIKVKFPRGLSVSFNK